jgi:hypothetical protein
MKKLVLAGFLLATMVGANAQNVASTTTLTSGGNLAGTAGTGAYYGANAGKVSTAINNTFIGSNAGLENTTGRFNTFIGTATGTQNTIGENNVFMGRGTGSGYSSSSNTIIGADAGKSSPLVAIGPGLGSTGSLNSFYGRSCGASGSGSENAFFGANAGVNNSEGSFNTYIGTGSGFRNNAGSGNVLLGYKAGFIASGNPSASFPAVNNQLYIDNSSNPNPLIWGDFAADQLKLNGKVGIGGTATTPFGNIPISAGGIDITNYNLFVKGGILTEEVRVSLVTSPWADYVFAKDYNLKPLSEVEAFIAKNNHLPNVPSAKQVKEEGINVGEMARIQQEKIEELTLYIIAQNKRIEALEAKMNNK